MRFGVAIAAVSVVLLSTGAASVAAQVTPPRPGAAAPQQGPGRIQGKILGPDGLPLGAVAITIRNAADSAIVTGVLTGKDGNFRIEGLQPGKYIARVSLIGYKPRSSEVIDLTVASPTQDFGSLRLEVSAVQLSAIEAVGEKSQAVVVEADKTTYNTKNMPAAAGSTIDVLRAVPEIEVDVNDNVKLRGNQAVALHINGRPAPLRGEQLANFLKQLPGNRVAKVEVMPNPSAKHDPEGMGGIVNLVLKDDLQLGVSGSVSVNASTRNYQYANGRLNLQRGKLTLFSGIGGSLNNNQSRNWDYRQNLLANPLTSIEQNSDSDNRGFGGNLDWTAEYKVGTQAHFWSNAWGSWNTSENSGLLQYGILNAADEVLDRYNRNSLTDYGYGYFDGGVGFKQIFVPQKRELTIDGRFSSNSNGNESRLTKDYLLSQGEAVDLPIELTLNDVDQRGRNLSLQADFFAPLGKGRIDVGYRAAQRVQDNDNWMRIFESETSNVMKSDTRAAYDYEEIFNSLYSTVGQTFGKFGVNLGVRAEFVGTHFDSRTSTHNFDNDYNTVFPTLNLSYTHKPGQTARFLYSKRIMRPPVFWMNPVQPSVDPLNITVGNPGLRPSYTQQFTMDMSYTGSKGTIRVAPFFRYGTDIPDRIRTVDANGVATNRYENIASMKNYGSNLTLSIRSTGKLSGSVNFSAYHDERDGSNLANALHRSAFMWSGGGNLGYKVTPTLTAQAYGNYFPTQTIIQGRASGYAHMSVGFRQNLWGTKGSLSLNINDPFEFQKFDSDLKDPTFIQKSRSSFTSRTATLGLTYNFGKPPQMQSRRIADDAGGAGETIRVR